MGDRIRIARTDLMYLIWIVIFGVTLGLGGSVFSLTLPPEPLTRALIIGPFVAFILALNKMVLLRPLSVTWMLLIASCIGIFTFYLGPPNPYKPLFVFAGLAFDAGTLFRTESLRFWNVVCGYLFYAVVGACIFFITLYLIEPGIALPVASVLHYAVLVFWLFAIPLAAVLWKYVGPSNPPKIVRMIQHEIGRPVSSK